MAEEKKSDSPATPTTPAGTAVPSETPVMKQGTPSETKTISTVGVQPNGATPPPAAGGSDIQSMLMMFLPLFVIFYLLIIRPQNKAAQHQKTIVEAMKKGDKVILSNGIFGSVADIDGDEVTVIIDAKKDVRVRVRKESVGTVLLADAPK